MTLPFPSNKLHQGSVIAVTVLFMSFLLIGIVGAAYLLSSHLRIASLGTDYLQATYNAESGMELALYQLKHRREGFAPVPQEISLAKGPKEPKNSIKSSISYLIEPNQPPISIPLKKKLNSGAMNMALFYEDAKSTQIHDLTTQRSLIPKVSMYATKGDTLNNCMELNLTGRPTEKSTFAFESISAQVPCNAKDDLKPLSSFTDKESSTDTKALGAPYSFGDFLQNHTEVILAVKDISDSQDGTFQFKLENNSKDVTIAHPFKTVVSEGIYGDTLIKKSIKDLPQEQTAGNLFNVITQ